MTCAPFHTVEQGEQGPRSDQFKPESDFLTEFLALLLFWASFASAERLAYFVFLNPVGSSSV